jgi:serine/threonine-protein kinase
MAAMHAEGVYHADIKPDNILVGRRKEVKVIDFGLAWRRGEKKDRVQGTLEFLAPEQAQQKIVNGKTDIFNLGATMYRTFSGRAVPAELRQYGGAEIGTFDSFVRPLTRAVAGFPADLDELVRECIRCNPDHRPSTMREIRDRLRDIGRREKKSLGSTDDDA